MDPLDRNVAGVTCRGVLHALGDFLDGELPPHEVVRVQAHLAGCDNCARFGGHVGALVASLRAATPTEDVPAPVAARLKARLATEPR
jgi:anti-sigma factor RsiW